MNNLYNIGDHVRVQTMRGIVKIIGITKSGFRLSWGYFYSVELNGKTIQRIPEEWVIERIK